MAGANDKVADAFVGHDVNLQRFQAGQRKTLLKTLKQLEAELVKKLQQQAGHTLTKARQQALLKAVRATIATSYKTAYKQHKTSLTDLAHLEAKHLLKLGNTAVGVNLMSVGVSESVLATLLKDDAILGAPLREMWAAEATTLQQAFIQQMRLGIIAGDPTDKLIQRVRGTAANGFKDGIMAVRYRGAEMRVRTAAQSILNDVRLETYKANDDVIAGWQVQVTLDDRTSEICMAYSGMAWDHDGEPLNDETTEAFPGPPPYHPNCRSTLVPVFRSWGELAKNPDLDKVLPEAMAQTQASMDGQVAGELTYEQWLKRKPADFQQEVLGAGKYRLWKSGQIGLKDLIDQRGNPLSLAQLKAKLGE